MIGFVSHWFYFFCVCLFVATAISCQSKLTSLKHETLQLSKETNGTPVNDYIVGQDLNIDGLYYGTEENDGYKSAIVFRLNKKGGYLYQEHAISRIFGLEVKTPNLIKFQIGWKPDDIDRVFDGDFDSEHITGKFRFLSKDGGNQNDNRDELIGNINSNIVSNRKPTDRAESERIRFQRLDILPSPGCQGGLYSNREFNKESGDMIGAEVLLIPTSGKLFGVYTSGNGDVSYAFETQIKDNKFEFEITRKEQKPKFLGVCSQNKINISYVGDGVDIREKPLALLKRQELSDFFIKEPR